VRSSTQYRLTIGHTPMSCDRYMFAGSGSAGAALSQGVARPRARGHAAQRKRLGIAAVETGVFVSRTRTRIALCGQLEVEIQGRRIERELPGRQVRMIFAYLMANRGRPVRRDELMDIVWPAKLPAAPGAALSTLLARLRPVLGKGILEGRHGLSLHLPADTWIDLEATEAEASRAESELSEGRFLAALEAASTALGLLEQPLLPEFSEPWVEERRRELEDLRLATLEVRARAGLALGTIGQPPAERAARALIRQAPYRESGYALLMQVCASRGDIAEALCVFDRLRVILRDELGIAPSRGLTALNERLLHQEPLPTPA
jgi:DNA-binding SARP family transcriptional activator